MTLLAGDISSHNPVTSWPAFLGSIDVLIVKISEGTGYVWPGAPVALAQARAAGRCVGAYHFYGGGDPVAEADYFLAHYAWQPGEVPILDWEPTAPPADPDGVAAAFCQRVHDRLGVAPLVYMNSSTARSITWTRTRAASERLWVAQYGANNGQPGTPPAVGSWGSWAGWQYTSNGTRPGVTGPIDLSLFTGTADQWRAYGTPTAPTPVPLEDDMPYIIRAAGRPDAILAEGVFLPLVVPSDETKNWTNAGAKEVWVMPATWDTYGKLAGSTRTVTMDPVAVAQAVVTALPTDQAKQTAQLVVAGIGAKFNSPSGG